MPRLVKDWMDDDGESDMRVDWENEAIAAGRLEHSSGESQERRFGN